MKVILALALLVSTHALAQDAPLPANTIGFEAFAPEVPFWFDFGMSNPAQGTVFNCSWSTSASGQDVCTVSFVQLPAQQANPPLTCPLPIVGWVAGQWQCITSSQIQALLGTEFLVVSQNYFDLGTVAVGSSATASVTVTSSGSSPVTISDISIGGYGYTFSGALGPLTLAPQQSVPITIKFAPEKPGTFTGTLVIANNSTNMPTAYVNMKATAQ